MKKRNGSFGQARWIIVLICIMPYFSFSQQWNQKTSFGGGVRYGGVALSIGDKGYMGTGIVGTTLSNDFWEYDPATDAWTQKANFAGGVRYHAMSFTIGSLGYVGSGSPVYPSSSFSRDLWEYNPVTNTWLQKSNFPGAGRYTTVSFSIGTKGYLGTGWSGPNYNDFWEWDQATNAWTQKANFGGTARQSACGFALNGKGYVGTGYDGSSRSDFWEYNPATNTWVLKAPFPGAGRFSASVFTFQGEGYIGCGTSGAALYTDFWKYNPSSNTWSQMPNYPGPGRYAMSYFSTSCGAYVGTGAATGGGPTSTLTSTFYELSFPVTASIVPASNTICLNDSVVITRSSTNANSFNWDFDDGVISTDTSKVVSHLYTSAGTYTIRLIASNACHSDTVITQVTVHTAPLVQSSGNTALCAGTSSNLTASGALTYQWSPASGLNTTTGSLVIATPAGTTTYTVTGTDSTGCTSSATVMVNVNQLPTIQSNGNTQLCAGSSSNLAVTGATSYVWSPATGLNATTGSQVVASPLSTTTYTITGTDSNNCSSSTTVTLNVNPLPLIQANGSTQVCAGSSTNLTASGGVSYLWSPATGLNTTTGSQVIATPLTNTTYMVTGSDSNNCSSSATVLINVNPIPLIQASGSTLVCAGSSATLNASGGTNYAWSPAAGLNTSTGSQVIATPSQTTSYTVIGTDSTNCSSSSTVTVSVSALPAASLTPAGPLSLCGGNSATLQAPTGSGYSYEWYVNGGLISGANTAQLTVSTAGNYQVNVTDSNGCHALSNIVTVLPGSSGLQVTITSSPSAGCAANTIYLGYGPQYIVLTANAPGAASYLWSTGETTPSIQASVAGTYSVTVQDSAGCVSQQTPQSQITVNVIDIRCGNNLNKIMICHMPPGNKDKSQTLCISPSAVPAHLSGHPGDCIGPCSSGLREASGLPVESLISVYPNPFQSTLIIHSNSQEPMLITIRDLAGREIERIQLENETQTFGGNLMTGIYMLEVTSRTGTEKVIITKIE